MNEFKRRPRSIVPLKLLWASLLLVALTCLSIVIFFERFDSLLGSMFDNIYRSRYYIATYDDFQLSANSKDVFSFASGFGRSRIAPLKVRFADGREYELQDLTPANVVGHFPVKTEIIRPGSKLKIVLYGQRADGVGFGFLEDRLESVLLSKECGVGIDFGDGEFVELPVERERLLKLLGPPNKWTRQTTGVP